MTEQTRPTDTEPCLREGIFRVWYRRSPAMPERVESIEAEAAQRADSEPPLHGHNYGGEWIECIEAHEGAAPILAICGNDEWDSRYECVKPLNHPDDGPGLTFHHYQLKRRAAPRAEGLDVPTLRKALREVFISMEYSAHHVPSNATWDAAAEIIAAEYARLSRPSDERDTEATR